MFLSKGQTVFLELMLQSEAVWILLLPYYLVILMSTYSVCAYVRAFVCRGLAFLFVVITIYLW